MSKSKVIKLPIACTCKCGVNPASLEPHTCPYQIDIYDNDTKYCTCCDDCEYACLMDIQHMLLIKFFSTPGKEKKTTKYSIITQDSLGDMFSKHSNDEYNKAALIYNSVIIGTFNFDDELECWIAD